MNKRIPILLVAIFLAQSCLTSRAQSVPPKMNYQGVIADSSGVPLPSGDYNLTFNIYDSATGGDPVWGPRMIPTTVVDGQFNVALGPLDQATPTARELSAGFASADSYLEIQVDANPPIAPRQQILSAPFAFEAAHAATLGNTPGTPAITSSGTAVTMPGSLTAGSFVGDGSALTGLTAGQIPNLTAGQIPPLDASKITTGVLSTGRIPALDASKITTGVLSTGRIPALDASKITSGVLNQSHLPLVQSGDKTFSGNISVIGNFGIGTTSPGERLTIAGVTSHNNGLKLTGSAANVGMAIENTSASGKKYDFFVGNTGLFRIYDETAGLDRFAIASNGNVGIGTLAPTQAKLVVTGHASRSINSVYLNNGSLLTYWPGVGGGGNGDAYVPLRDFRGGNTHNVSIYASLDVAAAGFAAFSDARIKRVDGRSDAARDLSTLQGIEVTDYTYIDTVAKGTGRQKKVIAQQIEKVFPQAVRMSTDVVPDIYQKAEIKAGWVELATDLKKGERVRLITEQKDGIHEVLEVAEGRFRTKFKPEGDQIFVYGREVSDFRSVDYEAIAMLNVSATQELARQLAEKAARVTTLEQEVAALKQMVGQMAIAMKASTGNEQASQDSPTEHPVASAEIRQIQFTTTK